MFKGYFNTAARASPSHHPLQSFFPALFFLFLEKEGEKKISGPDLHPYDLSNKARRGFFFFFFTCIDGEVIDKYNKQTSLGS